MLTVLLADLFERRGRHAVLLFALDQGLPGPVNLTAPRPVTVREFADTLGRAGGMPCATAAPR